MSTLDNEVIKEVKSILISQPKPERSPYFSLATKHDIKIDFRSFIQVEGITGKEFRKSRINIPDFSAIIFTSRNSIKHFFRICEELRIKVSPDLKYFCASEAIALFLQKFITYRKRKVFFAKKQGTQASLKDVMKKHVNKEKFLLPCSISRKDDLPNFLKDNGFDYSEAPIYDTVASDLSDLENIFYDMIIFFSPLGIKSLYHNFPDFKQNNTRIAAFGPATAKIIEEYNLRLDIKAPQPGVPSMTMAIEKYLVKVNGKKA